MAFEESKDVRILDLYNTGYPDGIISDTLKWVGRLIQVLSVVH